jgi:SAM-dependent methyltransferase
MGTPGGADADPSVVAYDRELVPWLFGHWAEALVDLVAPDPSSRVADVACGSGVVVHHLLGRLGSAGRVDGVDIDAAMLTYAAAAISDGRVAWHEADAADLPFETESIGSVTCHQGLQFFPEPDAALSEIRRVLEPGGRFTVATWGRLDDNPWPAALSAAFGRLLGDDVGAGMSVVCALGDDAELEALLSAAGFEEIVTQPRTRTATHPDVRRAATGQLAALPSGSATSELTGEHRAELIDLMCDLLADHVDATGGLMVPSTCNFAQATSR